MRYVGCTCWIKDLKCVLASNTREYSFTWSQRQLYSNIWCKWQGNVLLVRPNCSKCFLKKEFFLCVIFLNLISLEQARDNSKSTYIVQITKAKTVGVHACISLCFTCRYRYIPVTTSYNEITYIYFIEYRILLNCACGTSICLVEQQWTLTGIDVSTDTTYNAVLYFHFYIERFMLQ